MKLSSLLLALALSPSSSAASQVLRGSQHQSSTPFRLLPVDKTKLSGGDTKLKTPSNNNNGNKLSAGSAADAALAGLKNVKKCKRKRVTSNNNAPPPATTNTANIFEVADPALTTTTTTTTSAAAKTSTTTTTATAGAFENYQSSVNKTTTIPTTTGTTTIITTLSTSKATEGVTSVQQETRAVNNNSNNVTSFEIPDSSSDWIIDVCDENGNVIPPNTYFPTATPGNDDFFLMSPSPVVVTKAPSSSGFAFTAPTSGGNDDDGTVDDDDSTRYSPGCQSFANNQVYKTDIVASVDFVYEILVASSHDDVDSILELLEGKLVTLLGGEMIHCESIRRSLLRSSSTDTDNYKNSHRRLESQVDGLSSSPVDTVSSSSCTYFSSSESTTCHSIQGGMTLYLRENSSSSSASESSTRALKIIMTTFNNNDGGASSFINDVDGLMDIRYISGTPDQDVGVDTNNGLPKNVVGGAAEETKNISQEKKELSSVGISLVAVGSVVILSLIMVGIKKSRGDDKALETYDEFYDEDQDLNKEWNNENGVNNGDDTSLNDTMGSVSSNDSQKTGKLAMIYNEEESVNNTSTIMRELQMSEAYAASHGIHDNDGSSTRQPVFVSTRDDESVEVYGVNNTSIYTQSSELTKPTFENPAGLLVKERNYGVDDTVEF